MMPVRDKLGLLGRRRRVLLRRDSRVSGGAARLQAAPPRRRVSFSPRRGADRGHRWPIWRALGARNQMQEVSTCLWCQTPLLLERKPRLAAKVNPLYLALNWM